MSNSQEVFRLRKEGKLEEALTLARAGLRQDPADVWNKRAAAWVFYDHIKKTVHEHNFLQAQEFLNEFDTLQLPPDEKILHEQIDRFRAQLLTQGPKKPKNIHALPKYYQNLVAQFPANHNTIGWDIYREIKALGATNQVPVDLVMALLRVYGHLNVEKPSLLHSLILSLALKIINQPVKLLNFIQWWNLANLRDEDFERPVFEQQTYNSLAEKVAISLAKGVEGQPQRTAIDSTLAFLNRVSQKHADNIWLNYHTGRLLVLAGCLEEAKTFIIPVVRAKLTESWAWELLAGIYPDNSEMTIACLCRALQTKNQEDYLVNIRLHLARLLTEQQQYEAAKFELEKVHQVKENLGHKEPPELKAFLKADWYNNTTAVPNNNKLYQTHAPLAEAIVLDDLPWIDGLITGQQPETEDKPGRAFIGYFDDSVLISMPVKHKRFRWLKNAPLGLPVRFKMAEEAVGKPALYAVEKREGTSWDLIPAKVGIIDHVNPQKKLSHIIIDRNEDVIAHHERFPEVASWTEGSFVQVRLRTKQNQGRCELVAIALTDEVPNHTIYTAFEGKFDQPAQATEQDAFGFIRGKARNEDIFIPKSLVAEHHLQRGQLISGRAIYSDGHDRQKSGWKAILVFKDR